MSATDSIAKILNDHGLSVFVTSVDDSTQFHFGADVSGLVLDLIEARSEVQKLRTEVDKWRIEATDSHVGEYRRTLCELAMYVSNQEWDSAMRNLPKNLRMTNDEACAMVMGREGTP